MDDYPGSQSQTWLENNFIGSHTSKRSYNQLLEAILQLGLNFKTDPRINSKPAPGPASKSFDSLPVEGITSDGLLALYQEIANGSTNWASPNFVGFPDAGNALPAVGAAILVPLLNQNLANQEICSPSATFIEMELVHWLRGLLGYSVSQRYSSVREIGGVLTLGGCLSNTIALMAARQRCFPDSQLHGLPVAPNQVCVLVPEIIEHYSIRSAMAWLGIGEKQVVRVPVDTAFRMQLDQLANCIDRERAHGKHIIACIAYAGDSRTMCVDNLERISECLRQKNVWFHVDACHGFQLAFSQIHRQKLRGINMADSITVDPHKVLWTPSTCSLVLFKEPSDLASVSTNSDLILKTQWSLGQITPFIGSKSFDALKLWSTIKYFGSSGIGRLIDLRLEMTSLIQEAIRGERDLILLNDTDINSCIFQFVPEHCQSQTLAVCDVEKLNVVNENIKSQLIQHGDFYIHGFMLKSCPHALLPNARPIYVLRTLNGNPLTTFSHIRSLLDEVVHIGRKTIREMQYVILPERPCVTRLAVFDKLRSGLEKIFQDVDHVCLMYGSSICPGKSMFSDIDLMIIARDDICTPQKTMETKNLYERIMREEEFPLDDEVPLERKLLVPLSYARIAARTRCQLAGAHVTPVAKTADFLVSDTMLTRLVFNVLTIPTLCVSGSPELVCLIRSDAEASLLAIGQQLSHTRLSTAEDFVEKVLSDGVHYGEGFLGYKDRPDVVDHLKTIWTRGTLNDPSLFMKVLLWLRKSINQFL